MQLDAAQILNEMKQLGLTATEYQPGLFPEDPEKARGLLAEYELDVASGWATIVLHDADERAQLERFAEQVAFIAALGARIVNVGAASADGDFESQLQLGRDEWQRAYSTLNQAVGLAREAGLELALHPHVGTAVETPDDIARVIENTTALFCYDSGHIYCGGGDPLLIANAMTGRVANVHLKDVDGSIAGALRSGVTTWAEAVGDGMFRPLGEGDLPLKEILTTLGRDYDGNVVIEQDIRLRQGSAAKPTQDMRTSISFLRSNWRG